MDGGPIKGEVIPIRLFLKAFQAQPTMKVSNESSLMMSHHITHYLKRTPFSKTFISKASNSLFNNLVNIETIRFSPRPEFEKNQCRIVEMSIDIDIETQCRNVEILEWSIPVSLKLLKN